MERDELGAWLRLTLTSGVGNATSRKLLAAFGLPQAVFEQSGDALRHVVTQAQAEELQAVPDGWAGLLDTTWEWLQGADATGARRRIVTLGDALYPPCLLEIEDPPVMLYLLGDADLAAHPVERSIAIVGSRNPTPQGKDDAQAFARDFAAGGLTVVSGLALGVDGAAHQGALEGAAPDQLATVAVIGTGLDRVYPRAHLSLARHIAQRGLLVSEYPLGTPPLAENFPKRNRIIAALSQGTLVVEAALKSGSLITARQALEQGKEVFAIPGSIHNTLAHGCHLLIRQGAKLVESAQDVLEELRAVPPLAAGGMASALAAAGEPAEEGNGLLAALGYAPASLDALIARTGLPTPALQAQLLELELEGRVARLPGGLFQRMAAS